MVVALAHRDAAASVGDVTELEAQHLAGPQPAVEHQQENRQIAQCGQTGKKRIDVPRRHRPGSRSGSRTRTVPRTGC
jgi:hypothetical protein